MAQENELLNEAWNLLNKSIVNFNGKPVGTVAAQDKELDHLNYDQVFVRDFTVSAFAFMLNGETEIVKNFLELTLKLHTTEERLNWLKAPLGSMPASFKVESENGKEKIIADYGEHAIARVTPVDSSLWWLWLLRTYVRVTNDSDFARKPDFQKGIRLILKLCLTARFDMFPTLLVPDGSFMIDRRMEVHGYPLEIQVLFYIGLITAKELLIPNEENEKYINAVDERLGHLIHHLREYYWLDLDRLNEIYRYKVEEFGKTASNKFNIYPDSIPQVLLDWLPEGAGFFLGNLSPGRIDFRFFTAGNMYSIFTSLASNDQSKSILNTIDGAWDRFVGFMPLKVCIYALEGEAWRLSTGADRKNIPWSYHNAGSWPFLIWTLTAASIRIGREDLAIKAIEVLEKRISKDNWREYYDGKNNRFKGKEARQFQTWTIAGYILAKTLLKYPEKLSLISIDENIDVVPQEVKY